MINRVLIVLKHFNFGGTERYAINLANVLSDRGVSVIMVGGEGPLAKYLSPKIKYFFAPIGRRNGNKRISEKIILGIAAKYRPQIIHAQCRNSLLCCQLARRYLTIPTISHEHLSYKENEYPFVVDELNSNCDKVLTIAPYIAQRLVFYGAERNSIEIILNGINLKDFPPITDEEKITARDFFNLSLSDRVILCLSRIVPGKNIEKLVEAFTFVSKNVPNAKLIIAGDDEWNSTKPQIEEKIKTNNLGQKILIYPGQFDIRKFHAAANIFCYPPINRGMAVMEAMASGLPIVARESVQKRPLVAKNNISGLLMQSDGVEELADKLTILLKKNDLASEMGQAARNAIELEFNLENNISSTLSIYDSVFIKSGIKTMENEFTAEKQLFNFQ